MASASALTALSPVAGRGAGAPVTLPSCDAVPDKFGAAAAIAVEARARAVADSVRAAGGAAANSATAAAGRGARAGGPPAANASDTRAAAAGAVAILIVSPEGFAVGGASPLTSRMAMQPTGATATVEGISAATIATSRRVQAIRQAPE